MLINGPEAARANKRCRCDELPRLTTDLCQAKADAAAATAQAAADVAVANAKAAELQRQLAELQVQNEFLQSLFVGDRKQHKHRKHRRGSDSEGACA